MSCEARAALGPPGLHTTTRELQTHTFQRPGASNTTKIPREDPPEREERVKFPAEEKKKSAKFWASHPSGPPPLRAHFPRSHHAHRPTSTSITNTPPPHQRKQIGQMRSGQIRSIGDGQIRFGQMRSRPKGGGPKISRFFSLSSHSFHSFFPLWGSSRGILVVFLKRRGAQMCRSSLVVV